MNATGYRNGPLLLAVIGLAAVELWQREASSCPFEEKLVGQVTC